VQELHGAPWQPCQGPQKLDSMTSTPTLSPSTSESSLDFSEPTTPPLSHNIINPGGYVPSNLDYFERPNSTTLVPVPPKMTRRASYDLFECIEQTEDKRFCEVQAHRVFTQIVDIVHHLDGLGISHRDIKDENLVVDRNLKVCPHCFTELAQSLTLLCPIR
jgi:serine/threonine protein kinase